MKISTEMGGKREKAKEISNASRNFFPTPLRRRAPAIQVPPPSAAPARPSGSSRSPIHPPPGDTHGGRGDGVRGRDGERVPRRRAAQAHQAHLGVRRQLRRSHEQVHHPPGTPLRIACCLRVVFFFFLGSFDSACVKLNLVCGLLAGRCAGGSRGRSTTSRGSSGRASSATGGSWSVSGRGGVSRRTPT